jgi:hypothetical protein
MRLIAMRIYDRKGAKYAADLLYVLGRSYVLQLSELVYGPTPPRIMSLSELAEWLDYNPEQIIAA